MTELYGSERQLPGRKPARIDMKNRNPKAPNAGTAGETRPDKRAPRPTYDALVSPIETLVQEARTGLKAAMNAIMLQTYWRTGEYIVEYELNGSDRAVYGDGLMRNLTRDLTLRLGRGFAHSNLHYMRKFYLASQKVQTSGISGKIQTSGFLTWSHYLEILRADDPQIGSRWPWRCRARGHRLGGQQGRFGRAVRDAGDIQPPLREQIPTVFARRKSTAEQIGGLVGQSPWRQRKPSKPAKACRRLTRPSSAPPRPLVGFPPVSLPFPSRIPPHFRARRALPCLFHPSRNPIRSLPPGGVVRPAP